MPARTGMATCAMAALAVLGTTLTPAAAQAPAAKPSVDCAKASGQVEELVCKDAGLAALDVRMADVFQKAMKTWPADVAKTQRAMQIGWIKGRNDCWKSADLRACVDANYKDRILELQIASNQLKPPTTSAWACTGGEGKPVTVAFYNDAEPKAAILKVGGDTMTVYAAPSASGARYGSGQVDFWEHQGAATIDWFGTKLTCKPRT
jgi:uncharacterized protein